MDTKNDELVNVEFKKSELFQIYLSITSRIGFAQQKWASAASAEEQTQMQQEMVYLTSLSKKVSDILN